MKPEPMLRAQIFEVVSPLFIDKKMCENVVEISLDEYEAIIDARDKQWEELLGKDEPVGIAEPYRGKSADHTEAVFHNSKVPVGTKLYTRATPSHVSLNKKLLDAIPNLNAVILWLENGCNPLEAAKELRIYDSQIQAAIKAVKEKGIE